jgi:hypothetical protein
LDAPKTIPAGKNGLQAIVDAEEKAKGDKPDFENQACPLLPFSFTPPQT